MNLQHFLTATERTDDKELRRAMVLALALEIPHNRVGYERFYRIILDVLQTFVKPVAGVIVVAAGEGLTMGAVMGPEHADDIPIAVSNPIFVDVEGDGFQANGDLLGASLPVKRP